MLQGASVELVTITADRCMDMEGGVATDGWREGGSDTCAVAHMAVAWKGERSLGNRAGIENQKFNIGKNCT